MKMTEEQQRKMQLGKIRVKLGKETNSTVVNVYVFPKDGETEGHIAENYFASSEGRIFSYNKGTVSEIMTNPYPDDGYYHGKIDKCNSVKHRFVWFSFLHAYLNKKIQTTPLFFGFKPEDYNGLLFNRKFPTDPDQIVIHHIDHNKDNNCLDNLEALPKDLHDKFHQLGCMEDIEAFQAYREAHKEEVLEFYKMLLRDARYKAKIITTKDGRITSNDATEVNVLYKSPIEITKENMSNMNEVIKSLAFETQERHKTI